MTLYEQYCQDIETGKIPSGIHVKNAVVRFKRDLLRGDLVFKSECVDTVINFFATLTHFTGAYAGHSFVLEPWEAFIVANLYGFYWKDGRRRFQTAYLELARKNGKTAFCSGLALYGLIGEEEMAAEVILAANSKDQAKIDFKTVMGFVKEFDPKEKYLKRFRADINFPKTNSFIKVVAADSDKLDGYNVSLGLVDEYHSAPNSKVRDVIRSSQGMRENPLLLTITTAGFDKSLPCYELRTVATEIIAGIKEDDSFFGIVYSLDDDDDWKDSATWIKANPNLDITVKSQFIKKQVLQAINSPTDEVGVKTKNLNIWCDSSKVWIPDNYILKSTKKVNREEFKGQDCYIGVDLSSTTDLTAVSYLFVNDNIYTFITDFYLPNDSLKTRADKELYKEWANHGYLKTTSGNVCDYDYITLDILKVNANSNIIKLYYDKYNATQWAIQCTNEGLPLEPFSQTIGNFNSCTKAFERLMLSEQVVIDDNPIMRYCLRNVEIRLDFNGNSKPNKGMDKKKIDGVIAALQALAAYQKEGMENKGVNMY